MNNPEQEACDCHLSSSRLTKREIEVMLLVAACKEDSAVAAELGISVSTAQAHVRNMRSKAKVHSRVGLVVRCYAAGILLPASLPPRWSGKSCLCLRAAPERKTAPELTSDRSCRGTALPG